MANTYDEQLSHMSHLMFYGANNESKKNSKSTSVMNLKEGADGKMYGIVSEGTKYYIKSCKKGDEQLTESFDYIGGFLNKRSCEYSSYADAVKDMNMRLMSLNEDHGKRMPVNEMKRSTDFMDKDMVEMQEEIARHRQILENIDAIYQNKKSGIGDRNIGVPEAPETQEYNSKVGDPFEDKADYEENRDNKETAKDHEKQGGPFEDETKYEESTDNIQKKDSNTPGDTYTDKAKYVPDNAVAAMHPSGGEVTRVKMNEDIDDMIMGETSFPSDFDFEAGDYTSREIDDDQPPIGASAGDMYETSFPEENPDILAAEYGEMGDPMDDLSPEEIGPGTSLGDDDLENDDFLSQFSDSEEYVDGEDVAGIDDMSGVDRNNLSADVIDNVVSEMVDKFSKSKKLDVISESVARSILAEEFDEKDDPDNIYRNKDVENWYDDDFLFGERGGKPEPSDKYKSPKGGLGYFLGSKPQERVRNMQSDGTLMDPRPGAPKDVNPSTIQYDPDDPHFLQYKYNLGQNDDPEGDVENSASWVASSDEARRFKSSLYKAQYELEESGFSMEKADSIFNAFRHGVNVTVNALQSIARVIGMSPIEIMNFLSTNNSIGMKNSNGLEDAKKLPDCIITPDGELPMSAARGKKVSVAENGWKIVDGVGIVGPSLKAIGIDFEPEKISFITKRCDAWDKAYGQILEDEETAFNEMTPMVQELELLPGAHNCPDIHTVVEKWNTWFERLTGLQSISAMIEEADTKRAMIGKVGGKKYNHDYDDEDDKPTKRKSRSKDYDDEPTPEDIENDTFIQRAIKDAVNEEITKLNVFGDHPGYRKKPMTTPANVEVAPNDARDWNDDSTKGEEPFGKQIGSSAPYSDIVDTVTREVLKAIKGGLK